MPSWRKPEYIGKLCNLLIESFVYAPLADFQLCNYSISQLQNSCEERVHGKYIDIKQRRTQEGETYRSQEAQGGETA